MKKHENKFGSGDLYDISDLDGKVYIQCAACISLYAEALSWANAHPERITPRPEEADHIITVSCQVTDLAVYNDLINASRLCIKNESKKHYIAGCLAHRFDIAMPEFLRRLDHFRTDYQHLDDRSLVNFLPPFWVKDFASDAQSVNDGYRMREMYPLRIGVGCTGQCAYCTIRVTRGQPYNLDNEKLRQEFLAHDNVVLVSDNPSVEQVMYWCRLARDYKKSITLRNVEPTTALGAWDEIMVTARAGYLHLLHAPIQSLNPKMLASMKRPVGPTLQFVARAQMLRQPKFSGRPVIATNIIIDEDHPNYDPVDDEAVYTLFDSVSWNPMWDGKWDLYEARKRFLKLFPWHKESDR